MSPNGRRHNTNINKLSSLRLVNRMLISVSAVLPIIACQFLLNAALVRANAIPLHSRVLRNVGLEELEDIGNDDVESYDPSDVDSVLNVYLNDAEDDIHMDIDGFAGTNSLGLDRRAKRLTVDFNGIQVSYPQYVRLMKLQSKVLRLRKMIERLHSSYSSEMLQNIPQYQRLMTLYNSLAPLLPEESMVNLQPHNLDKILAGNENQSKRSSMSVKFMGMKVSYPQYLRLVALQEKVVRLDKLMRRMLETRTLEELQTIPKWHTLVALHNSLKKMLPEEYLSSHETFADAKQIAEDKREGQNGQYTDGDRQISKRSMSSTIDFNGVQVSYPQYWKLMEMQKKVMQLDAVMQRILEKVNDPKQLEESTKWKELTDLRTAMGQLFPSNKLKKRAATMEFNGVQVSLPQYEHLMSLQKKVLKLDAAMKKIAAGHKQEKLKNNPKWQALVEIRNSLIKLIPNSEIPKN